MFSIRVVAVVGVVFFLGMALFAMLNFLKFERLYQQEARLRYDGVAQQVASTVVRSLRTGLSLDENAASQVIMDRTADRHDGAIALYLRDREGNLIRTNSTAGPLSELPPLPKAFGAEGTLARHRTETDFFTTVLINVEERAIGAVTVRFGSSEQAARVRELQAQVIQSTAFLSLATLPLLALLLTIIITTLERRARSATLAWRAIVGRGRPVTDADLEVDPALRHVARITATLEESSSPNRAEP
ncbi:MAG: hypothetical protein AAF416_14520 [Pseudomonadota bacterium]